MRVLVLGANGFIGKHLTRRLLVKEGLAVTVFSRSFDADFHEEVTNGGGRIVRGNYNNPLDLVSALRNHELVYHLISESVASTSWNNPTAEVNANLLPTINLFQLCVDMKVKKIVYASSGGTVYGKRVEICREEDALRPYSPYGIVKVAVENFLAYFRERNGLQSDVYRISNPYGPGLDKPGFGVVNTWLRAAVSGKPIVLYGDGTASKDYIFIEDVIDLLLLSLGALDRSETFNIASGQITSLNEIADLIRAISHQPITVERQPGMPGDNTVVKIANDKVVGFAGGKSFIPIGEGIRRTYEALIE